MLEAIWTLSFTFMDYCLVAQFSFYCHNAGKILTEACENLPLIPEREGNQSPYWFGLESEAFVFIAQQRLVIAPKKVKATAARVGTGQGFSQKQDILDEPNLKEIWTFCG